MGCKAIVVYIRQDSGGGHTEVMKGQTTNVRGRTPPGGYSKFSFVMLTGKGSVTLLRLMKVSGHTKHEK